MWTSQGCGPSTRITLSASAVTEERSEFITRTGSPWISPSWFSQSAGYFSRRERVSASNSLDIRPFAAHEVSIKIRSDIGGHPRFRGTREWMAASAPPTDWLQLVNQPQTEAEVAALRCCVNRGRPFGDPNWVTDTAKRLGLECTVQPRGRLKKQSLACHVYSDLILQIWWLSPFMSPGGAIPWGHPAFFCSGRPKGMVFSESPVNPAQRSRFLNSGCPAECGGRTDGSLTETESCSP